MSKKSTAATKHSSSTTPYTIRHHWFIRELLIKLMGDGCLICGYNNYIGSLAFHHVYSHKKELDIKATTLKKCWTSSRWDAAFTELKKCVVLCHNHHSEVHANRLFLPKKYKQIDNIYSDFQVINNLYHNYCLNCYEPIQPWKEYCPSCAKNPSARNNKISLLNTPQKEICRLIFRLIKYDVSVFQIARLLNTTQAFINLTLMQKYKSIDQIKTIDFDELDKNNFRIITIKKSNSKWLINKE